MGLEIVLMPTKKIHLYYESALIVEENARKTHKGSWPISYKVFLIETEKIMERAKKGNLWPTISKRGQFFFGALFFFVSGTDKQ
jgi:hypothetical protein